MIIITTFYFAILLVYCLIFFQFDTLKIHISSIYLVMFQHFISSCFNILPCDCLFFFLRSWFNLLGFMIQQDHLKLEQGLTIFFWKRFFTLHYTEIFNQIKNSIEYLLLEIFVPVAESLEIRISKARFSLTVATKRRRTEMMTLKYCMKNFFYNYE